MALEVYTTGTKYCEEKAQALAALANLIESIAHPTDKAVPMHRRK